MAGQAVGQASGMAKDAAFGFAKNKWDQNKDDIMAKGASAGMSALSSAGNQFKNITGTYNRISKFILPRREIISWETKLRPFRCSYAEEGLA